MFDQSEYLYGNAIRLLVYQGKARLGGVVETAVNRDLAAQLALGVAGITAVDNKLVIESGYQSKLSLSGRNYTQMAAQAVFNAKSFAQAKMDTDLGAEEQEGWGVADA